MKVELELPEWCDERHIYIIAGTELAAYRHFGEDFHVKTSRCNECGKCCMNLVKGHVPLDEHKTCIHLGEEGPEKKPCKLGAVRPWPCIEGDPIKGKWKGGKDFCSVRYDGEAD